MDWANRKWDFIQEMKDMLQNYQSSQTFSLADVMQRLPALPEADVEQLLAVCLRCRGWYALAVLAAVRYNQGLRAIPPRVNVKLYLTGRFCFDVLKYFETDLPLLQRLLSRWSGCVKEKALVWSADQTRLNDKDLEVFQTLVNSCSVSDIPVIKRVMLYVDSGGSALQYEVLVHSAEQIVRQAAVEYFGRRESLFYLVIQTCLVRVDPPSPVDTENKPDYSGCLAAACEAGLFSVSTSRRKERRVKSLFDSPIGVAVYYNQPDVVKFLYSTGTVDNRELFRVCHDPELVRRSKGMQPPPSPDQYPSFDDGDAAKQIRGFLLHKASRPRSLQSLCLREVSTRLGWGHDRKANVEQLDIPKQLKEALQFKHNKRLLKK